MKKFQKAAVVAKNLPTGSYAAGCPVMGSGFDIGTRTGCKNCERTK